MSLSTGKTPDSVEENNSAYPNMRDRCCQTGIAIALGIGSAIASIDCAIAQVVPDATLGAESSVVTTTPGSNVDLIQGGATRGANLFHSFEQFSVLDGREARFDNATVIQNIISRVTGASSSNIDGLIRANGTANLFLINPNGITFGPNASLNIGGSFVGSTASSLNFADGTVFSATAPQPTPLLTVSVPVGLQFGETRGSIVNQSRAINSNDERGLQVQPGKTLALVGGNVGLDGGALRTEGGRVELAGVAEPATVGLNIDSNNLIRLSFAEEVRLADVTLTNQGINRAEVNVSAVNSGSIAVTAGNINILGGSSLRANRQPGSGSVNTQTGDITLNATEAITVANDNSRIVSNVQNGAVGNGGSINITTGSLLVNDGARLESESRGQGDAGNVTINAREAVSFDRGSAATRLREEARGQGGDISITTGSLFVTNGGFITVNTFGQGDAGNVTIRARDRVSLDGVEPSNGNSSRVVSNVESPTAVGNGGNVDIRTGSLEVINGAAIGARTRGQGDGGNIILNANTLKAVNGGLVATTSDSSGKAGNITLDVLDSVTLAGSDPNFDTRLAQFNENVFVFVGSASGLFANTLEYSTGQGGDLRINTGQLVIQDGAEVNVSSNGSGAAGNLEVAARSIRLENQASLSSDTTAGQGNIILNSQDLVLRRRSNISTNAQGTATGGNITIDTGVVAALEDSDITANAVAASGGRVLIGAQGIFGTEFRREETTQSDITASSRLGSEFSGTVEINTPDIDPNQGLVALPSELVDVSNQIAAGCAAGDEAIAKNEFIITGRGGLPPSPTEPLSGEAVLTPWATLEPEVEGSSAAPATRVAAPNQIVEANGWAIAANGQVILTASAPNVPLNSPAFCRGS